MMKGTFKYKIDLARIVTLPENLIGEVRSLIDAPL